MMELADLKAWFLSSTILLVCVDSVLGAACVRPGDCAPGLFCHTAEVCISCDNCSKERHNLQHCSKECHREEESKEPVPVANGPKHLIVYCVCGAIVAAVVAIIVVVVVYRRRKKRTMSRAVMETVHDHQKSMPTTTVGSAMNNQDYSLLLQESQIV